VKDAPKMKSANNTLIGIILVAQSQLGGAQLCFRYPMNNSNVQVESILKSKEEFILPSKSALPVVIKRHAVHSVPSFSSIGQRMSRST
jgi:hypothetical protein